MNRLTTILAAMAEAFIAAGIVLGIPLAVFSLIWLLQDGMTTDMAGYARAAAAIWLLSLGVPLGVTADLGGLVSGAASASLVFSLVPLSLTLVTVLAGFRAGRRVASLPRLLPAWIAAVLVQLGITAVIRGWAVSGGGVELGFESWILPVLAFVVPVLIGSVLPAGTQPARLPADGQVRAREAVAVRRAIRAGEAWLDTVGSSSRFAAPQAEGERSAQVARILSPTREALRIAAVTAVSCVAAAAAITGIAAILHWADIVTLFESLHADILGVVVVSLAQLAYVPNAVLWAVSWVSGVGFAIGTGSSVSPLGTQTGPLPAFPMLGALPPGELSFGYLALAVPLLAAAAAVITLGPGFARALATSPAPWPTWAATASLASVGAGAALGLLVAFSSGSLGTGRLVEVGPNAVAVAAALAGLFAVVVLPGTAVLLRRAMRVAA